MVRGTIVALRPRCRGRKLLFSFNLTKVYKTSTPFCGMNVCLCVRVYDLNTLMNVCGCPRQNKQRNNAPSLSLSHSRDDDDDEWTENENKLTRKDVLSEKKKDRNDPVVRRKNAVTRTSSQMGALHSQTE